MTSEVVQSEGTRSQPRTYAPVTQDWKNIGQSISMLQKELDQVSAEKARVTDQREQYQSQLEDTVQSLVDRSTAELKSELQEMLEEKECLQERLRNYEVSANGIDDEKQQGSLQRELQRVTAEREAAWELIAGLQERLAEKEKECEDLRHRSGGLNISDDAKLRKKTEECENLIESRIELQDLYAQALRENDVKAKRIVNLQEELQRCLASDKKPHAANARQLDKLESEIEDFHEKLQGAKEECRDLVLENEELQAFSRCVGSIGQDFEQIVRDKDNAPSNLSQQRSVARQLAYMESIKALQRRLEQTSLDRDGAVRLSADLQNTNETLTQSADMLRNDLHAKVAECEKLAAQNQVLSSAAEKVPGLQLEMERAVVFFQKAIRQQDAEHALASENAPSLRSALLEASVELDNARLILDADAEKMSWSPLHPAHRRKGTRKDQHRKDDTVETDPRDAAAESAGWNDLAQRVLERELEQAVIERRRAAQENTALQQQLTQREDELKGFAQQASELKRWNTVWRGELSQKIEEHEDLLQRSSDLGKELERVVLEQKECTEQAEAMETTLRQELHERERVVSNLKGCMGKEMEVVTRAETQCEEAVRQHMSLMLEVEHAEQTRIQADARSSELRSQLFEKVQECDILSSQNTDYKDVSQCLGMLQSELEQIARDTQGIAQQKESIQRDLDRVGLENLALARENSTVSSQLQDQSTRVAALENELKSATTELRSESETVTRQSSAFREMSQHIRDLKGELQGLLGVRLAGCGSPSSSASEPEVVIQKAALNGKRGLFLSEPPMPLRGVEYRELARNVSSLQSELLRIAEKGDEAAGRRRALQDQLGFKMVEHEETVRQNASLVNRLAQKEREVQQLSQQASDFVSSSTRAFTVVDKEQENGPSHELCSKLKAQLDHKAEEVKRLMTQLTAVQGELVAELQDNEQLANLVKVLRSRLGET
eukprot:gnl/MRDRNA2_/MRDRNA2_62453_c0_seq1.p1 gnl/MRDRNA2_/MRDRNA2_62453_c0~~gnl/MRDRNA2_/MRDRNA2_62453_c0_seq1.p1  ORF type:complete len:967 (-),score=265.05 gnl/MRDRNA2_/MRDRNA2_62453_c0_seq1:42-2903(-)